MIAKSNHELPVFASVRVLNHLNGAVVDSAAWISEQRSVEPALGRASFRRGCQLRARKVGLHEFVCNKQPALPIAIYQIMATGKPKISHPFSLCVNLAR